MTQEDILNNPEKYDLSIETVGKGTLKSPMKGVPFVSESDRVSLTADIGRIQQQTAHRDCQPVFARHDRQRDDR